MKIGFSGKINKKAGVCKVKVERYKREENLVSFEVEADFAKVLENEEQAFQDLSSDLKIPGFRQGKVPRGIFEAKFGREMILSRAAEKAANHLYPEALKIQKIDPVDFPTKFEITQLEQDKPFRFSIEVEVKPEVKLGKYKGIKVEVEKEKVDAQKVEQSLDQYRSRFAVYEKTDKAAGDQSEVVLQLECFEGDQLVPELQLKEQVVRIGGRFFPEKLEKEILGLKAGGEKEFDLSLGQELAFEHLRDKTLHYKLKISEVREKILPEWNQELLDKLNIKDKTVDQLREETKQNLEKQAEQQYQEKITDEIIKEIIENSKFTVPEIMIKKEQENQLHRLKESVGRMGISYEQYLNIIQKPEQALFDEFKPQAEKNVRADLILEAIEEKEEIKASEEDVQKELEKIKPAEQSMEDFKQKIHESWVEQIKHHLQRKKTLDFIVEQAKVK